MVAPAVPHPPLPQSPADPRGPSLRGRALLALAFLCGFYVLAFGSVAALVGANVALFTVAGRGSTKLVLLTGFVAVAVVRGVFFITRSNGADIAGVPIDRSTQPDLVGLVHRVAADIDTAPPDRIYLAPEVNAYVTQTGGLLGLRGGERIMVIGVPLMLALTVDQLKGVIAHELGHYAGGDTRLGPLTYRAGASVYRTVEHLGEQSMLGRLFAAYGHRFLLLSQRVRRRQELSADAAAVRQAGREGHASALRRIAATSVAFDHFVGSYLVPLWEQGCDVDNAFEGYSRLLADPARQGQLDKVETALHDEVTDPFDSHPALAERVAYAHTLPERPSAGRDGRPARALLRDGTGVEAQVGALLTSLVVGRTLDRVVDWDTSAADVYAAGPREASDALLRAAGKVAGEVAGEPDETTLESAIALIEYGWDDKLAATLVGPLEDRSVEERAEIYREALTRYLGCAIGCYLAAERGHAWAVSWSGPLAMVDGRRKPKDPFAMASALLDDPREEAARLRRTLGGGTRLARFRVDPEEPSAPEPTRPEIVLVVPGVTTRRHHFDAILTTCALVLHPFRGGVGYFVLRGVAQQGLHGPLTSAIRRRLERLFSRPSDEVLGAAPDALTVPLDRIRRVSRRRSWALEIDIEGMPGSWRLRCSSKEDCEALLAAIREQRGGVAPAASALAA